MAKFVSPSASSTTSDTAVLHVQTSSTTLYFLAQCPKCKTVETLQFIGNTLSPSRKFRQKDGGVYHDCGSDLPCRLHR